jgi:hypothetical protein
VWIVPPLDELEHGQLCLCLGFETTTLQQLAFKRSKETFGHGVVEAVAYGTH